MSAVKNRRVALAALALLLAIAAATDVYVAIGGDDLASGAADAPFALLEKALSVAGPGDRVTVRPGVYRVRLVISK